MKAAPMALAWLAALAAPAGAGLHRAPVVLQGEGPYHRLALPASLTAQALSADLTELRVRNGAGQAVPFAWDEPTVPSAVQWAAPVPPDSCSADSCDYTLPRHFPLYRLRVALAQPNTLAQVQVLGLLPAGDPPVPPPRYRHHHNPLKVLRRHERPPPSPPPAAGGPVEMQLAEAVVYHLVKQGVPERSADIALGGGVYPRLRVRVRGGVAQLGLPAPAIEVGTLERSVVFLARDPAPFSLTWGAHAGTDPGAMTLATLIPRYKPGKPPPMGTATVDMAAVVAAPAAPVAAAAPPRPAPVAAPAPPQQPARAYDPWLWAALAAAVAVLGGIAWSLLRAVPQPPRDGPPDA